MYKSQSARRTVFADAQRNNIDVPGVATNYNTNLGGFGGKATLGQQQLQTPLTPTKQKPAAAADINAGKATPPLPRQNSKAVPPSPPAVIRDMSKSLVF